MGNFICSNDDNNHNKNLKNNNRKYLSIINQNNKYCNYLYCNKQTENSDDIMSINICNNKYTVCNKKC